MSFRHSCSRPFLLLLLALSWVAGPKIPVGLLL